MQSRNRLSKNVLGENREKEDRRNLNYIFGQPVKVTESGVTMAYIVEISRNVFVEEDPSKRCTNYPTTVFQSYKECDDWFMRSLLSKVSPDLIPIWLTDDMGNVSTLLFDALGEFGGCI